MNSNSPYGFRPNGNLTGNSTAEKEGVDVTAIRCRSLVWYNIQAVIRAGFGYGHSLPKKLAYGLNSPLKIVFASNMSIFALAPSR